MSDVLTTAIERPAEPCPPGYRMCTRCVMDTTDPEIVFDASGVCTHCTRALALLETRLPMYRTGEYRFDRVVERMRVDGRGRRLRGGAPGPPAPVSPETATTRVPAGSGSTAPIGSQPSCIICQHFCCAQESPPTPAPGPRNPPRP